MFVSEIGKLLMKKLICTMIITIITTFANTNHYDLTVGTIRYYDDCRSYGSICVAAYQYWGIEEIVGDILINDKIYSIVNWKSKTIYWDSITNNEETSYYRFADGLLYKFTSTGDSILQNFNFTKGDSLINFFQDFKSLPSITNPPSVAIYDTIVDFCDGS